MHSAFEPAAEAVITASPFETPVTTPLRETVATFSSLDVHCTPAGSLRQADFHLIPAVDHKRRLVQTDSAARSATAYARSENERKERQRPQKKPFHKR